MTTELKRMSGRLVVLFADAVGSTELKTRIDYVTAIQRLVNEHNKAMQEAIEVSGGRTVKFIGDGVMGAFELSAQSGDGLARPNGATRAVSAAMRFMEKLHQSQEEYRKSKQPDIRSRVGIAISPEGEPPLDPYESGDPYGQFVDIAARVQVLARPGQILITQVLREALESDQIVSNLHPARRGETDFFSPVAKVKLKGVPEHVGLREVIWNESQSVARFSADIVSQIEAQLNVFASISIAGFQQHLDAYTFTLFLPDEARFSLEPAVRVHALNAQAPVSRGPLPLGPRAQHLSPCVHGALCRVPARRTSRTASCAFSGQLHAVPHARWSI